MVSFLFLKLMMKQQYSIPKSAPNAHQSQTRKGGYFFACLMLLCVLYGSQKQRVSPIPLAAACCSFHLLGQDDLWDLMSSLHTSLGEPMD